MKLEFVELCGFRGYRRALRLQFADRFTIVDGRNGAGKSTIFDAIEYALTGALTKYDEAKADGETVADYLWWTGDGPTPTDRYVEVGFSDGDKAIKIRRGQFDDPNPGELAALREALCDTRIAPASPLEQLCESAIIRDEHITGLSLDLKETERYALLRNALGASDADAWIARGGQLVTLSKRRTASVQQEVTAANGDVATAARRLDQVRASLATETTVAEAVERLRAFAEAVVPPDELSGPARERIAAVATRVDSLQALAGAWAAAETERSRLADLRRALQESLSKQQETERALDAAKATQGTVAAASLVGEAVDIISLVQLGRKLGMREKHCPLCMKEQSHEDYERGIRAAELVARRLNDEAVRAAESEQALGSARMRVEVAARATAAAETELATAQQTVDEFDGKRELQGIPLDATLEDVGKHLEGLRQTLAISQRDLRIIETLRFNTDLEQARRADADARARVGRAQERYGRALKTEAACQALHDAARRAAGETLDVRLERVLPLMSELYRRLRPHPFWTDIEYSIRGDVRRFLKLQVGGSLNPQFLFSSGQRRATGLAFLLSVNLSLAWSRLRTVLLDDPVQHVDDFRTVHLAELLAQLVAEDRQIICAVEDAALADLLCRRLPVRRLGEAKRMTLGSDADGAVTLSLDRTLAPLARNALVTQAEQSAAG